jgi:lysophospholipase L1-like esterase
MKGPVRDSSTFSFNASAKTITFSAPIPASQQQILAVLNVTRNAWLYLPVQAAYGGTWASPVLTVTASTTGHSNSDVLQIFVDDGLASTAITAASLPLPSGAATAAKQPALGTAGTPSADVVTVQGNANGTALPVAPNVTRGSGTLDANTQRVTLATDGATVAALTSLDSKAPSKGAATTANSTPVTIASDQALHTFETAGFRENILYREAEPFCIMNHNGLAPVTVPTGSVNTVITGPSQAVIGKSVIADQVIVGLNQPGIVQLGFANIGPPTSAGTQGFLQVYHPGTSPLVLTGPFMSRSYGTTGTAVGSWGMTIRTNLTGGSVNYVGSLSVIGWRLTDDFDFTAPKVAMFVGDSLLNGTGPTATPKMYPFIFKSYLNSIGQRVRVVLKSISGTTAEAHETYRAGGYHDINQCDLIVYQLGVNDAVSAVSGTTFTNYLTLFWNWASKRYPTAKMLILGVPPLENNTSEANAATLRTAAANYVASVNSSRLAYINLGGSFDRTLGTTVYASSDTAGSRLHPNDTGHAAIAATLQTGWASLGWTV